MNRRGFVGTFAGVIATFLGAKKVNADIPPFNFGDVVRITSEPGPNRPSKRSVTIGSVVFASPRRLRVVSATETRIPTYLYRNEKWRDSFWGNCVTIEKIDPSELEKEMKCYVQKY